MTRSALPARQHDSDPWLRMRQRLDQLSAGRSALLVFLVLLGVYLPTATWDLRVNTDAAMAAMPAWNVAEHGTLDLQQHRDFLAQRDLALHESRDVGGGLYSGRNPGAIAWGIPFYVAAAPWTPSTPLPMAPAAVAASMAAAGAMAVLSIAFRRLVSPARAAISALVLGTATTTWAVSADALWTHGPAQFWLAVAVLAMAVGRPGVAGMGFGISLLARPYVAFGAAAAGLVTWWHDRRLGPLLRLGVASLLGVGVLLVYTRLAFDRWSILGGYYLYEDGYVSQVLGGGASQSLIDRAAFHGTRFLRALVDPDQGLLVYSPTLVLLAPGLGRAWRAAPTWVRAAAVAGLAELVAQVMINGWWGGDFFFGYRYTLEAVTLASPLFVLAWREHVSVDRARSRLVAILIAVNVLWIGYGAAFEPYKG